MLIRTARTTLTPMPALLVVLLIAAGCSKTAAPLKTLTPEQVAPTLNSAFKDAKPEVKAAAGEVVSSVQSQDAPRAFLQLESLTDRSDLTPEQRSAAALSRVAVMMQLQAAADIGNKMAEDLLQKYRASK